jgi:hypothetical protein
LKQAHRLKIHLPCAHGTVLPDENAVEAKIEGDNIRKDQDENLTCRWVQGYLGGTGKHAVNGSEQKSTFAPGDASI